MLLLGVLKLSSASNYAFWNYEIETVLHIVLRYLRICSIGPTQVLSYIRQHTYITNIIGGDFNGFVSNNLHLYPRTTSAIYSYLYYGIFIEHHLLLS